MQKEAIIVTHRDTETNSSFRLWLWLLLRSSYFCIPNKSWGNFVNPVLLLRDHYSQISMISMFALLKCTYRKLQHLGVKILKVRLFQI